MRKVTFDAGQYVEYDVIGAASSRTTDRWMRWVNEAHGTEPTEELFRRYAGNFAVGGAGLGVLAYLGFLPWMGVGFSTIAAAVVFVLSIVATHINYRWRLREMSTARQFSYHITDAAYRDHEDELVHWSGQFTATP